MPSNARSPTIASQLTVACASEESNGNYKRLKAGQRARPVYPTSIIPSSEIPFVARITSIPEV